MTSVFVWFLTGCILFLFFILLLVLGIKKRNKKIAIYSIMPLFFALLSTLIGALNLVSTSYKYISAKAHQFEIKRTGNEIYAAIFNKHSEDCLKILNYKDQVIPGLDCCIWLEFKTCPLEISRVLKQGNYALKKTDSSKISFEMPNYSEKPYWWNPKHLGDSALIFKYSLTDKDREQILITSMDTTHAFYCDIVY